MSLREQKSRVTRTSAISFWTLCFLTRQRVAFLASGSTRCTSSNPPVRHQRLTMYVDAQTRRKVLALSETAVANFDAGNWLELGTLTGSYELITTHDRLLRSLRFGDPDYSGCALQVLMKIVEIEPVNYDDIEKYIDGKFGGGGECVSSNANDGPRIYFQPSAFKIPSEKPDLNQVSAMMPFSGSFSGTYNAIQAACAASGMRCMRADNIWQDSAVIQDIFELIFKSFIVVC